MIQHRTAVRIASLAGFLFAVGSAHAMSITFMTSGMAGVGGNLFFNEAITSMTTNPAFPGLNNYQGSFGALSSPGTATASNGGANSFGLSLQITGSSVNGPYSTLTGSWTFTGGTGAYAVFVSGGGTFSWFWDQSAMQVSWPSASTVIGQLNPVPEPAPMAIVGLGLVGLVARRRRS